MAKKVITPPLTKEIVASLRSGDEVLINGTIYTGRDAAHKRLCLLIEAGQPLPIDLQGQILYFTGPTPATPGRPIGSAGPTTSSRMDAYSPLLIEKTGLAGMIGKGGRSEAVIAAMRQYGCIYFAAVGGAGALIAQSIVSAEVVLYPELGPEAIYKLTVRDLPVIVAIDSQGGNLYVSGPLEFARS
jgi:fumarate hydratase subunit beta